MKPQLFIDTNVWFSAFYGSPNAEALLKSHFENQIDAVISQQVLQELITNIKAKIPHQLSSLQQLLQSSPPIILKNATTIPRNLKSLVSPEDLPLITTAIQAKIPYFVTGNTKDFNIPQIQKKYPITILTPKQSLELTG